MRLRPLISPKREATQAPKGRQSFRPGGVRFCYKALLLARKVGCGFEGRTMRLRSLVSPKREATRAPKGRQSFRPGGVRFCYKPLLLARKVGFGFEGRVMRLRPLVSAKFRSDTSPHKRRQSFRPGVCVFATTPCYLHAKLVPVLKVESCDHAHWSVRSQKRHGSPNVLHVFLLAATAQDLGSSWAHCGRTKVWRTSCVRSCCTSSCLLR